MSARILFVAGVGAVFVGIGLAFSAVTAAAFTDEANLNLSADGIGSQHRFDIGVVRPSGAVEQAEAPRGFDWVVAGSQELVPGHAVTTEIPVFNNTPQLNAETTFKVVLRNGDGTVANGVPNITPFLRFTAEIDGAPVFVNAKWDDANGILGQLAARGSAPLSNGDRYRAGAAGSEKTLKLTINYLDAPGVEDLNGGQSALAVHFDAESVRP